MARTIVVGRDWKLKITIFGTDPTATLPDPQLVSDEWSIRFPFGGYNRERWTGDAERNGDHRLYRKNDFVKSGVLRDLITYVHDLDTKDIGKKAQADVEAREDSTTIRAFEEKIAELNPSSAVQADESKTVLIEAADPLRQSLRPWKGPQTPYVLTENEVSIGETVVVDLTTTKGRVIGKILFDVLELAKLDGRSVATMFTEPHVSFGSGIIEAHALAQRATIFKSRHPELHKWTARWLRRSSSSDEFARYGHHPDREIDAEVECGRLEGELYEAQIAAGLLKSHRECERCGAAEGIAPPMCSRTRYAEPHNFETGKTTMVRYTPARR